MGQLTEARKDTKRINALEDMIRECGSVSFTDTKTNDLRLLASDNKPSVRGKDLRAVLDAATKGVT